jgi:flavin-dependent dehydrogenase
MYDAIIIGARCAGSPTAMLLAKKGYRVLLLDRASLPSDMTMSTHLVHARGVALLRDWGLLPAIEATDCSPMRSARIDLGPFSICADAPGVNGMSNGYAPRRLLLDEILIRAAERAGAEIRERCTLEEVLGDDGQVSGIRASRGSSGSFSERARIVIGADGPGSRLAACVQAEEYNARPALQATAWTYWSGVSIGNDLRLHLREYEAIYAFPTSNRQVLIGANWAIDRFKVARQDLERSYFGLLEQAAPELAEAARAGKQEDRLYVGSTRSFLRKPYGKGWALVGDAGYKKDPCTAQGITDAFLDAELITEAVDDAFSGRSELGDALARYHARRDEWAMPYYELTCDMARFAPPPPEMLPVYEALRDNPKAASEFIGLITEAVSPIEFFAPANIERIVARARG